MSKIRPKICNRKLKIIGHLDGLVTLSTCSLVFFMVIGSFYPVVNNVKRLNMTKELEFAQDTRRGYLGFYSSTIFLVLVGLYSLMSAWMLVHASKLKKKERKKQFQMVNHWVGNALEILIIMTMAWFSLLGEALINDDCKAVFTNTTIQIPYLFLYKLKLILLLLVYQERLKYSMEDMGLTDENWETWQTALGLQSGSNNEDVENGLSEGAPVGGQTMSGGTGRRNRLRARRNRAKINRLRSNVV